MTNRLPTIDTDDDQQVENAKVDALVNLAAGDAFDGYPLQNSDLNNSSLTISSGDGLKNGGSVDLGASITLDIEPADFAGAGLQDDGTDDLELVNDTVTVAGNAVSLGGSTSINHSDLSSVTSDQHHAQDQSTNYKDGGSFEIDAAELAAGLGANNEVLLSDGSAASWGTVPNSGLTNDSVTVNGGDGLKNGGSVSLGNSITIDVEPNDFAGTSLEDDGADNLQVADAGITATQVDESDNYTWTGSQDFTGATITVPTPTSASHPADKEYVDSVASGLDVKDSVVAATDGSSVDLSSATDPNPIDGVTLSDGERVLLKDQNTNSENGIYVAQTATDPTTWTRASDFDDDDEVTAGAFTFVEEGTTNADVGYVVTSDDPISVGTDDILFGQFSGAGSVTAGDGLDQSGDTFSIDVSDFAGSGLQDDGSEDLELVNDTVTVAGNAVSLGGSTAIDHNDLSTINSDDHHTKTTSASDLTDVSADSVSDAHHAKYTNSEARSAVEGTTDVADLVGGSGTSGQVAQTDGTSVSWVSLAASDISDVSADSVADAHHAQDQSSNYKDGGSYEIDAAEFAAGLGTADNVLLSDGSAASWGTVPNAGLTNDSVTVTAGDGLKNGGSVSLGGSVTIDIEPADFAGSGLSDDGSDNLEVTNVPGSTVWNQRNVSSSVTLSEDDSAWVDASGGAVTVTLPSPSAGAQVRIIAADAANTITVSRNGTENINGSASDITLQQDEAIHFESDGTDWWIV